jgi:glycosyltransferase involved in cell wall biosynthesis
MSNLKKLPITVLLATKNEEANIARCLAALGPAARVIVLDSHSTDQTPLIAAASGAEVVQFTYSGRYPKKRQWALDNLDIRTPWVLLLDADEVVPPALWEEICEAIHSPSPETAYLITKQFHFLGKRFRFGGFSFAAVLLIRTGKARFERLPDGDAATHLLDMEVHERVIVDGSLGQLHSPLIHQDFKDLQAYLDRHNRYSTWEASLRYNYLTTGQYGQDTIRPRLFGNTQERRRFLKNIILRLPLEPWLWFAYHYFFRLGFLEGRRGLIASQIRAAYIGQVRAKVYELKLKTTPVSRDGPWGTIPIVPTEEARSESCPT